MFTADIGILEIMIVVQASVPTCVGYLTKRGSNGKDDLRGYNI
jgi:hypothetical protein